jgi:hypothetical protein
MWHTTPLKRNLVPRFRESRIRMWGSEDKNWDDRQEMIEEMIETTLYALKVSGNQGWNVDQGMVGSKIIYSNQITQTSNCFMSSSPGRCGEVQRFVFSFLVVDEGLQLSLTMTSLDLLASESSDRSSKGFWGSTTNIG